MWAKIVNKNIKGFPGFLLLWISVATSIGNGQDLIQTGQRILFLGDSNTYAGHFISDLDAYFHQQDQLELELLNLGLPSETCCGLSEPDHPFPRPTVQERSDRVLDKTKPNVVICCYGMNDGIYHPFSENRFKAYQSGMRELIKKIKKINAKVILLTPPPFDPLPLRQKNKLVPKTSKQFAWFLIYEDYDSVMKSYSDWIISLKQEVDLVIDIRTPVSEFLNEKRKSNPAFTMSPDGVHFNQQCHRLIARSIAKQLMPDGPEISFNTKITSITAKKMNLLRDAWLSETGHKRPGVKAGLPLATAKKQAAQYVAEIQNLK